MTKSFVVDASFVLAFLLKDEKTKRVDDFFISFQRGEVNLVSVQLLDFEVCNTLRDAWVRKRVDKAETEVLIEKFERLNIEKRNGDNRQILEVALEESLTFYDAAYLGLARELDFPLLSLDKHLKKYAHKI